MIPNSIVYPYNFVNRRGIPLIESAGVTVENEVTTITIANRAFRFLDDRGVFLFRLNTAIPSSAASYPINFSWTGFLQSFSQQLTLVGGDSATGEQLSEEGVYFIYYDKSCNLLQLINSPAGSAVTQNP